MAVPYYMTYPPLPNQATQDFIDASGITATGNLFDDFRSALVAVTAVADHNSYTLDDLWQLYVINSIAADSNTEAGNPASAGRGKSGFVGGNPGHYYAESHRRNPSGGGFPAGASAPDQYTLHAYPLQDSFADSVSTANGGIDATLIGTDGVFIADAGPFGVGDYAFDPSAGTSAGDGTKGAQVPGVSLGVGRNFTAELWFYMPTGREDGQFQHIMDFANAAFTNEFNMFYNYDGGTFALGITGDGIVDNVNNSTVPKDTWIHMVIEYDIFSGRIYWAHAGNTHSSDAITQFRDNTASVFGMGMGNTAQAADNTDFNGYIAHVRLSSGLRYDLRNNATYTVPTEAFALDYSEPDIVAPSTITGLTLHLDADLGITEDVNGVSLWEDQSAAGNDVSQTDNLQKPITATIGSMPVVTFDRAAEVLERTAASVSSGMDGPDITVFTVVNKRYAGEGGIYPGVIARQAGNWSLGWRMAPDNSNVQMDWACQGYTREAYVTLAQQADTGAAEFHIYTGTHNSTTDTSQAYVNGFLAQANTSAAATLDASSYNLDIGNGSPDHSRGLFGSIAEILVYDSVLSTDDREAVIRYLTDKYPVSAAPAA